jgi:hypothetical protein
MAKKAKKKRNHSFFVDIIVEDGRQQAKEKDILKKRFVQVSRSKNERQRCDAMQLFLPMLLA